ncbi:gonadoliberin III [Psychromonas sp. psych-6C06]|uniref:inactive transglutaminase family protein n=1 Tax=Psychromonas sp. psych-6C06 TaxID=2058089 RepID=UPI000C31D669|nr:inactive transglutaminase family protein [Psychromonas sp. psych-6C06]PKF60498.1 gonadoliberin III [Psychromonas sp. psych-6C06]
MNARSFFFVLVAGLMSLGIFQTVQRHMALDIPWMPGETRIIWNIDAKIDFNANEGPVLASLTTPERQAGFTKISQNAASPGYGLSFIDDGETNKAEWTIREAKGKQTLYYNIQVLEDPKSLDQGILEMPELFEKEYEASNASAGSAIIKAALKTSADSFSFTREVLKQLNAEVANQNVALILTNKVSKTDLLIALLNEAKIPTKKVGALVLEDGRRRQHLTPLVEVFQEKDGVITSKLFDANSLGTVNRDNLLLWDQSGKALLELTGGSDSKVSFSMIQQEQPALSALLQKSENEHLFNFSIHSLPVEDQSLFKGILMIPLGVLIVVMMRVLVGLKTSGTFMPVLIAMAFIQTSLVTGLVGFILLVAVGLFIRSYLSHLNLLLVSRISTVIIMVILLIALFGVLSYKLGLTEGLKITFFPMIILSWTIERMSVLWEEEGAKEVMTQGGGSLLVAVLAYFVMSNDVTRHLMFNFIGLQFVVMSLVLLLGSYTGYRLLELRRFKPLADKE